VGDRRTTDGRKTYLWDRGGAATEREMDPFPSMEKDPAMEKRDKWVRKRQKNNNQPQQKHTYQERERGEGKRQKEGRRRAPEERSPSWLFFCFFFVVFDRFDVDRKRYLYDVFSTWELVQILRST